MPADIIGFRTCTFPGRCKKKAMFFHGFDTAVFENANRLFTRRGDLFLATGPAGGDGGFEILLATDNPGEKARNIGPLFLGTGSIWRVFFHGTPPSPRPCERKYLLNINLIVFSFMSRPLHFRDTLLAPPVTRHAEG